MTAASGTGAFYIVDWSMIFYRVLKECCKHPSCWFEEELGDVIKLSTDVGDRVTVTDSDVLDIYSRLNDLKSRGLQ